MKQPNAQKNRLLHLIAVLLLLGSGCKVSLLVEEPKDFNSLPQYWLTTSLFVGAFYDDDKLNMVDYRPFYAIDDAQTLDGFTLLPKKAEGTIPAGTLVQILSTSFPDKEPLLKRPLNSPRDNIWVYLRIGRERGKVTIFREKPHVLVIPKMIKTEEQLHGFLKRFLSKKDPNRWLLQQESHVQAGIFEKRPVIGMKRHHLIAALGPANKKQFHHPQAFEEAKELWHYYDYLITIVDDAVTKISPLNSSEKHPRGRTAT
jgi:hypothetical protein